VRRGGGANSDVSGTLEIQAARKEKREVARKVKGATGIGDEDFVLRAKEGNQ